MKSIRLKLGALILPGLLTLQLGAQDFPADSAVLNNASLSAIAAYHAQRGTASAIFNGIQHFGYPMSIEGNGYYGSDEWRKGSVVYEGITYKGLLLKYDLVADQLLVQHPNGFGVGLYSPRVQSFRMQDQDFIYLPADSSRPFMPAGFYRWVAKGKLSVLEKSSKLIDEFEDGLKMKKRFLGSDQFYILKDGHYYPIKKKNDLLLLTGDKRKEVVRYLKQNRISFKKMREQALSGAADIYNR